MNECRPDTQAWKQAQTYLTERIPGFMQSDSSGPLTLQLDDEEWFLEVTPQGVLVCQAGYDLEDMKSILSDGTAEDLGTDELAKQAKFYLQQTVSKYRNRLLQDGFVERVEMNDEFVAVMFEKPVDFHQLPELEQIIKHYRKQFTHHS